MISCKSQRITNQLLKILKWRKSAVYFWKDLFNLNYRYVYRYACVCEYYTACMYVCFGLIFQYSPCWRVGLQHLFDESEWPQSFRWPAESSAECGSTAEHHSAGGRGCCFCQPRAAANREYVYRFFFIKKKKKHTHTFLFLCSSMSDLPTF